MRRVVQSILVAIALVSAGIPATVEDLDIVIQKLITSYHRVEDYSVRVTMSVAMPGFRMPRKQIDLYYKRPDMIKIESDGFAVVPKTGLRAAPDQYLSHLESATLRPAANNHIEISGTVSPDSITLPVAGISESENLMLNLTVRVDTLHWLIDGVEVKLDTTTLFRLNTIYEEIETEIWLPVETRIEVHIPGKFRKEMPREAAKALTSEEMTDKGGQITLKFTKYKVNKGLKGSFFKDSDGLLENWFPGHKRSDKERPKEKQEQD